MTLTWQHHPFLPHIEGLACGQVVARVSRSLADWAPFCAWVDGKFAGSFDTRSQAMLACARAYGRAA